MAWTCFTQVTYVKVYRMNVYGLVNNLQTQCPHNEEMLATPENGVI